MANVYYQYEVFVAAGETVQGVWEIDSPFNGRPDTATLVVWEPVPYDLYPFEVGSFTYNETQITLTPPAGISEGQLQFWKTVTNATYDINTNDLTDASFINRRRLGQGDCRASICAGSCTEIGCPASTG